MVEYGNCKCGGNILEKYPGVDWDDMDGDGQCLARELICSECGREFQVFYNLDRIECQTCEEHPTECTCDEEE